MVTEVQVEKAIRSLKNKSSSGIDFISPKVIKMSVEVLTVPMWHIINSSITEGDFPNSWKYAKVTPIYKNKGSRKDKKSYRPVSNLKSASKVLELIINQQILQFFENQGLFPKSQHGFRSKRSTFSAIANMHEEWLRQFREGNNSLVAFFDLSAAFDTLSKEIFCKKLKIYGFDEKSVEWFRSYLTNRSQMVMVGASMSEECRLNIGSPQGAILSPTIFIILISSEDFMLTKGYSSSYPISSLVTKISCFISLSSTAVRLFIIKGSSSTKPSSLASISIPS